DLASEVFTIAWTAGEKSRAHPGWVFVTARHALANARRARARFADLHRELSGQIASGAVPGFVQPSGHDCPATRQLYEAMGRLPREQQELLVARYWDELSGVECAELFGCTHTAVRIRLHHARRALAALCRTSFHPDQERL
ncbi:MAG: sigma-70 region 4 domain-containing protein, partial [Micrococcales bacterium]|nr:sigma-70 region 4 domain-containing protein [Micrococcales bacterium]